MGLFARFVCLRRKDSAHDLAQTVQDMLRQRNVVQTTDPAEAERLLMIAPAGPGWLMVVDHVERPSEAMDDADGLLAELSSGGTAVDLIVADSDDLVLSLIDGGVPQGYLVIGHSGVKDGTLEPWERLLQPGRSVDDIPKAFATDTTFVEEQFPALKPLFGLDLAAFDEVGRFGREPAGADVVLLRLKTVAAPGQSAGPPRLEVDDSQRRNYILNDNFSRIPCGLITHVVPAFDFQSRGGGARGLDVRLTGSAVDLGLVEVVSAKLLQEHPVDRKLRREIEAEPEATPAGPVLHFTDIEVPDWVQPDLRTARRGRGALQDLRLFVWCRGLKPGDGELVAEAHLVAPRSQPVRVAYPVTVLPEMWRPFKGSDRPT